MYTETNIITLSGGYAAVVRQYAVANNKLVAEYLHKQQKDAMETDELEGYDSSKEQSYIFATDCTNEVSSKFDFVKKKIFIDSIVNFF